MSIFCVGGWGVWAVGQWTLLCYFSRHARTVQEQVEVEESGGRGVHGQTLCCSRD
jgi:hypothetical protein